MDFELLQTFNSYIDAHIVMGRLKEEGINCWLKDEHLGALTMGLVFPGSLGGIKLMVEKDKPEKAIALLQQPGGWYQFPI